MDSSFFLGALVTSLAIGIYAAIYSLKNRRIQRLPRQPPLPPPATQGPLSVIGGWNLCVECRGVYPPGSSTSDFHDDFCSSQCQAEWFSKHVWKENPTV